MVLLLYRRRELRWEDRACQLASSATPIRYLGVLAPDEQRCSWKPDIRGGRTASAPSWALRPSSALRGGDQNAQMVHMSECSSPDPHMAATRELRVGSV